MSGPSHARSQKLAVQHYTLEVYNLFTKARTFTPVFRLLLVMMQLIFRYIIMYISKDIGATKWNFKIFLFFRINTQELKVSLCIYFKMSPLS